MTTTSFTQHGSNQLMRLSSALTLYNRAFRNHLSTVLGKKLGPGWWQEGIVRMISAIQEDIEKRGFEIRTDDDAKSVLEPKHYHRIVSAHRESFPELSRVNVLHIARTGGSPRTLMHEVADWRNVNAHPPSRDLDPAVVDRAVDAMVRLVGLFDSAARYELLKLSGESRIKGEPAPSPNIVSEAKSEATRIVEEAEALARTLRDEAEREAMDIVKKAEAIRSKASQKDQALPTSRSGTFVARGDREKLDRIQHRVRQLEDEKRKAQSELKSARRNIIALRERASTIEEQAKAQAEQTLRAAREEAETIRLQPRQSETFQSLLSDAMSLRADQARRKADLEKAAIVARGKAEAEDTVAAAHKKAASIIAAAEQEAAAKLANAERIRGEAYRTAGRGFAEAGRVVPPSEEPAPRRSGAAGNTSKATGLADGFRRRFNPAKSGNGHLLRLKVDGWWLNCWVGRTRGVFCASVFAPEKNGTKAQTAPLMERDCSSEDKAFAWLRNAEASGLIQREARHAISLFERFESDDDDIPF